MIRDKRHKYSNEQTKEMLKRYLDIIEKVMELDEAGDKEAAERMYNEMRADVQKQLDEIERKLKALVENKHKQFNRKVMPDQGKILGEKDGCKLIAFDESYRELYLKTEETNAIMPHMYEKDDFRKMMWENCLEDSALYYGIINRDNAYVGYVAIKDTRKPTWEVAIVLLPAYRYKGYGKAALTILFDELYKRTGEKLFRARVDSDNYDSQALFRKMGARTNGISEFMLHGEALEKFQKENLSLITEKLEAVAEEFCTDAEDLLGNVLEYLIDWPQE